MEVLVLVKAFKNSKGSMYYYHRKGKLGFFSKQALGSVDIPQGFAVKENKRTGLLFAFRK